MDSLSLFDTARPSLTQDQRDLLAQCWYGAIATLQNGASDQVTLSEQLRDIANHAIDLLLTDQFVPERARAIGIRLVELQCVQPERLERMLNGLGHRLLVDLPTDLSSALIPRVVPLLSSIAAGVVQTLQNTNTELLQAHHRKDEFLAKVSHELRTPLHTLLGLAEGLLEETYGTLEPRQRNSLQIMWQSGQNLQALINDMLDVARIDSGKLVLDLGLLDVNTICQASLKHVDQAIHEHQLRVSISLDAVATHLVADEQRLTQILVNLLDNAIRLTPAGGTVGLSVIGDAPAEMMHFTVSDSGSGIPPERMHHLFQPFAQLDDEPAQPQHNTGLGLVLARQLARLHQGDVTVKSVLGQGTQFTVSLPWRTTVASDEQKISSLCSKTASMRDTTPAAESRVKMVLAEDNEANMVLMSAYFERKGYEVVVAKDGVELIEHTQTVQPAVVLMDVQMPRVNGLEAIQRIRCNPATQHIPIIVLTGLVMPGDRERCLALGADAYLSKPMRLHQIVEVIESVRKQASESTDNDIAQE